MLFSSLSSSSLNFALLLKSAPLTTGIDLLLAGAGSFSCCRLSVAHTSNHERETIEKKGMCVRMFCVTCNAVVSCLNHILRYA